MTRKRLGHPRMIRWEEEHTARPDGSHQIKRGLFTDATMSFMASLDRKLSSGRKNAVQVVGLRRISQRA